MDASYIQERIDKTKEHIALYDDAITAILTGGAQSYTLDTGQSVQKVTKLEIPALQRALQGLENKLCTLEARLNGAAFQGVPAW